MRCLVQRVSSASVTIDGSVTSSIGQGLLILLGIGEEDTEKEVDYLCRKVLQLRIFSDSDDKLNLSIQDIKGELLIVSQFTLYGDARKGNRPSFVKAAKPDVAIPLYERFLDSVRRSGLKVEHGIFGADMAVELVNDGPVTIWLDTAD
ncbi:MAG TPA: D-tyrosyl-tRNA(Tyr) deacylase [Clostridiaceae bacterium]|nr:D-tyrosyl-tRNA(Tyr) deacylase [Clostridiaceae bacterium]